MANYTRTQNFTVKDSLDTGDAEKIISGTDVDGELNAIATAIASKAESSFESGVKMVFVGASAPSGWSLVTTYDDKVLIIQNAAGEDTGGNWSVNAAGDGFALKAATTGNVPNHTHSTGNHTHTTNNNHTHGGSNLTTTVSGSEFVGAVWNLTNNNPGTTFYATGNFSTANYGAVTGNDPLSVSVGGSTGNSTTVGATGNPNGSTNTGNPNTTVAITMATALSGTMVNGNYRPAYVNSFICSKN
jgi:hypothetical protein